MADTTSDREQPSDRTVRAHADAYVTALADLNPVLSTALGTRPGEDRMPDLSPAGYAAEDELARATLAGLDAIERTHADATVGAARAAGGAAGVTGNGHERRCARLLRERLTAGLAFNEIGERLRAVSNILVPPHVVRLVFTMMPAATPDDWAVIARRMTGVPGALTGYRASLTEGARLGLFAASRQVVAVLGQLAAWIAAGDGRG
ncbi:MAG TPA: DUF885 family protein, partial [Pseudonocardiaceae bacterium]|nr:DUF885 family protein [Pseudonocardiaceae bacterium]